MDLLMTIVREFLLYNSKDTKVILMSATIDVQKFVKYFTIKNTDGSKEPPAVSQIEVKGNYMIEKLYLDDLKQLNIPFNYMSPGISEEIYDLAKDIIVGHLKRSTKSILVFLPGIFEIESLRSLLQVDPEVTDSCLICVLHSSLSTADQRIAFMPANKSKVVLSTNIAESSITITNPEVDCIIDFCLTKYLSSRDSSISSLKLDWTSKSSMEQRAGRTGRTCDGKVYRLIQSRHFKSCPKFAIAEMARCPLENVILRVKTLDVEAPATLLSKALHPPDPKAISNAVLNLKELGAMVVVCPVSGFVSNDGTLTYVGRIMATLPLDTRITRLIILGYIYSVLDETIIIGAALNVRGIFRKDYNGDLDDYKRKLIWADGSGSDLIAMLNAYKLWQFQKEQGKFKTPKDEKNWCRTHSLEQKSLLEMLQLVEEITSRLTDLNLKELTGSKAVKWEENRKPLVLKICIAGAFLTNFFINGQPSEDLERDIYKQVSGRSTSNIVYFRNMNRSYIGQVYQEQIKRKLVESGVADKVDNIDITFDRGSTKVFVQFNDSNALISNDDNDSVYLAERFSSGICAVPEKIMPEVYKAVKLKQLGYKFEVDVMSPEESKRYADKYDIDYVEMGGFARKKNLMKYPELCVLPTPSVQNLKGYVTHIEHCNKFYFQPCSDIFDDTLNKITLGLIGNGGLVQFQKVEELIKFQQVIISDNDEFKRAKVIDKTVSTQTAKCFTFDYGQTIEVPLKKIYKVTEAHKECFEYSERCFVASLTGISPSVLACPQGKWTHTAIEMFRSLVKNKVCSIQIYSCVEEIVSVELWSEGICVNNALLNQGLAQECEEIFTRKDDNESRKIIQASEYRFVSAADEFGSRVNTLNIPFVPEPPKSKCCEKIILQGPISPVHSSFISPIYLHNSINSVNIDISSVNSVFLYDDPGNLTGRLVVAAAINRNNNGLTIHETTIMPNISGLPVILAMMFAPNIIFKRNNDRTRYDYVLFGLGADPVTHSSYFPEHDCILPVNFVLDSEDFEMINHIRLNSSHLLMTQQTELLSSLDDDTKQDQLSNTKELLWKILSKHRPLLPLRSAHNRNNDWSTEDQKDAEQFKNIFNDGFRMFAFPPLYRLPNVKKAKMLETIEEFENLVKL